MGRQIQVWVLLLCLLVAGVLGMLFGWAALSGYNGTLGPVGRLALKVASFPDLVAGVYRDLTVRQETGYENQAFEVARDQGADYSGFAPVAVADGIVLPGLLIRADPARMARGWRLLAGGFAVGTGNDHAALLLDPDLKVVKVWTLDEIAAGGREPAPKNWKLQHGIDILPDASIVFTFDEGMSLQRFDTCGKRMWSVGGQFDHTVTLDDSGTAVWILGSWQSVAKMAVADGAKLAEITMDQIIAANPMIDILEIRRTHNNEVRGNPRDTAGKWESDPFHLNDVEPLPAALAAAFPMFKAGDLLISARNLNLVFVLDPDTLAVKWWSMGAVQRQHDPDWLPSGEISVLNNRMSRDFSEVVAINPATGARRVMFEGRQNDFYTRIRGKQQSLPGGGLEVTSAQQGRAFEVDASGAVVLEVINTKPGDATENFVISEMKWLPEGWFAAGALECGG